MSARTLLEDLRSRGVVLAAEGGRLVVEAPVGAITNEIRTTLATHKPRLLKILEWEQHKVEEADRRGLVIRWSEHPGWIALHDPTTGDWHEVRAEACLPGIVESANRYCDKRGDP